MLKQLLVILLTLVLAFVIQARRGREERRRHTRSISGRWRGKPVVVLRVCP